MPTANTPYSDDPPYGRDQLRYLDVVFKLPEQMVFKVDRASMAASVEARAFYLYHPLVEYALSLPTDRLIRQDGKYLLKRYLERHVPKENLYPTRDGVCNPVIA